MVYQFYSILSIPFREEGCHAERLTRKPEGEYPPGEWQKCYG